MEGQHVVSTGIEFDRCIDGGRAVETAASSFRSAAKRQRILSTVSGEVVGLKVTTASSVFGNREFAMEIIPKHARPLIEGRISSRRDRKLSLDGSTRPHILRTCRQSFDESRMDIRLELPAAATTCWHRARLGRCASSGLFLAFGQLEHHASHYQRVSVDASWLEQVLHFDDQHVRVGLACGEAQQCEGEFEVARKCRRTLACCTRQVEIGRRHRPRRIQHPDGYPNSPPMATSNSLP